MVKTSIIVPVYNTAKYLTDCFGSIFKQTQQEIEVIAINDGSTDDSLRVLEEIQREHPELIIFSQENKGLGAVRNKGMELATGEFIYFIDSDDCLVNNAMEICYSYAKTYNADIIMFDADEFGNIEYGRDDYCNRSKIIKEQGSIMSGEEYAQKYWLNAFFAPACFLYISARFLKKNNLNFLPRIYYEDVEFHCKAIPLAESVIYIPKKLYRRRRREDSITGSKFDDRHAKDYLQIIRELNRQKHSANLETVIREMEYKRLSLLLKKCKENDLLTNKEFIREFYETAQKIFGYNIEKIEQYCNINVLYQLSNILDDKIVSDEIREKIQNKWKKIMDKFRKEIPLVLKNKCVGIYGTGMKTEEFLDMYGENVGAVESEVIYIESNVRSGERKYRSKDVFNVNDIGGMPLDCIVITSSKYEKEMYQTIKEKYDNRFKVICLKSDLYFL